MDELICFIKGHKSVSKEKKRERLVFFGEKAPQYETYLETRCERCGKWQHPFTGKFIGI